jgi:hypothetical protein
VSADFVGARNASIQHTQFYSSADPERTYVLSPYAMLRAHVRSVGLHPLGKQRETVVSHTFVGPVGDAIESGYGGVDIPALGPRVMLGLSQEL